MTVLFSNLAICRAVLRMRLHQQLVENVFFFRTRVANSPSAEVLADIRTHTWDYIKADLSSELLLESITLQELYPTARDPEELVVGQNATLTAESCPSSVACVVSLKTGLGGRRNRGRKYVAGLAKDESINSRIDDTRLGSMQTNWDSVAFWFRAANSSAYVDWGLVHRSQGGTPVPIDATNFVPITSVVVRSITGTMRTRIPGHGA